MNSETKVKIGLRETVSPDRIPYVVAWLRDLASGKYLQTYNQYRQEDEDGTERYCGLGLLRNVTLASMMLMPYEARDMSYDIGCIGVRVTGYVITTEVYAVSLRDAVIWMNDTLKLPFEQMAFHIGEAFGIKPEEYLPQSELAQELFAPAPVVEEVYANG